MRARRLNIMLGLLPCLLAFSTVHTRAMEADLDGAWRDYANTQSHLDEAMHRADSGYTCADDQRVEVALHFRANSTAGSIFIGQIGSARAFVEEPGRLRIDLGA